MGIEKSLFQRSALLLGNEVMERISARRVIIFGIGGVGSWCAESLVRTGFRHVTIVDSDRICVTNINRQLHATVSTVGHVKTEVLKNRLLDINPHAEINAIQRIYNQDNHDFFHLEDYDYIIDAIDSISSKIHLIRMATKTQATLFSSMGASLKIDPGRIRVDEFWKVNGCPLGSVVRKRIRKGELPAKPFLCVYSDEVLENKGTVTSCETDINLSQQSETVHGDPELANHEWSSKKAVINGTTAHVTAIFGFTLAGLVVKDVNKILK